MSGQTKAPPSGPVLALDCSTFTGSVAVADGERILAEVTLGEVARHSVALMPAIDAAVRWAGLAPTDLRGVIVAGGPGSFTGLRIAAAAAKGLVFALELPLWSYSGLLAAAAGAAVGSDREGCSVCALFDARRGDVYAACYRFRWGTGVAPAVEEELSPSAVAVGELLDRMAGRRLPLFTGDGALLHRDAIHARGGSVVPPHLAVPRASSLAWLLHVVPELGRVADPVAWEPEYVRAAGAERIAASGGAAR